MIVQYIPVHAYKMMHRKETTTKVEKFKKNNCERKMGSQDEKIVVKKKYKLSHLFSSKKLFALYT